MIDRLLREPMFQEYAARELAAAGVPAGSNPAATLLSMVSPQKLPEFTRKALALLDTPMPQAAPAPRPAPVKPAPPPPQLTPQQEKLKAKIEATWTPAAAKAALATVGKNSPLRKGLGLESVKAAAQAQVKAGMKIPAGTSAAEAMLGYALVAAQEFSREERRVLARDLGWNVTDMERSIGAVADRAMSDALAQRMDEDDAEHETRKYGKPLEAHEPKEDPDSWEAHIKQSWRDRGGKDGPRQSLYSQKGERYEGLSDDLAMRRKTGEGLEGLKVEGELAADVLREHQAERGGNPTIDEAVQSLYEEISPPYGEAE